MKSLMEEVQDIQQMQEDLKQGEITLPQFIAQMKAYHETEKRANIKLKSIALGEKHPLTKDAIHDTEIFN